ncbi:AT-rich interactive domain-containing protein 1B-like isoform X2 [Sycon ciliatum]|uniref:AT-rich interactive domain-containing protein 1B-like isoform X2 n=1 Tax=Sycon ciliatum TaxID=27933 RepID=UPI0031F6001E
MARNDVKKQDQSGSASSRSNTKLKAASTEQLRMAEMMDGPKVDPDRLAGMVRNVMEVTSASEDKVAAALHDCGYDEGVAIHSLLEGGSDDNEWTNVTSRNKKTSAATPASSFGASTTASAPAFSTDSNSSSRGRAGRGRASDSSGFGAPAHGFGPRDDHTNPRGGGRWNRSNGRGGGAGGRGGRQQQTPANRGRRAPIAEEGFDVKNDDSGWPAAGNSEVDKPIAASGVWGAGGSAPSWGATMNKSAPEAVPKGLDDDQSDRWSTDVNATPRFNRTADPPPVVGNWADATVSPSANEGWGMSTGAKTSTAQWGDDISASPVKQTPATWPSTQPESKEESDGWPTDSEPVALVSDADVSAKPSTWQSADDSSHQLQIESWRDNVDGHASEWTTGDVSAATPTATATAVAVPADGNVDADHVQDAMLGMTTVESSEQLAAADDIVPTGLVVELPSTSLESYHMTFPAGMPEAVLTSMFVKRPEIPAQPVEMPTLHHVIQDISHIQFGNFQTEPCSTPANLSSVQDDRLEYVSSAHQTLASPSSPTGGVSGMEGLPLSSTSPIPNLTTLDSPLTNVHHGQMGALSHVRPPPGHASLAAPIDTQPIVAEGLGADGQPSSVGANALLSLSSDLLPTQSGAIAIPGSGAHSSSAHSTPAGSLGTSGFLDRASSNVGSAPGADSGITAHQSPLIVGTPPAPSLRSTQSPAVSVSPSLTAQDPSTIGFHSASPPAPIAMPPSQQQQQQQPPSVPPQQQAQQPATSQQAEQKSQPQTTSAATTAASQGSAHTEEPQQPQRQQRQTSSQQGSSQSSHHHQQQSHQQSHHQQHHQQQQQQHSSTHSQTHGHQHQQTSGQSSSGSAHHGHAGAPPGISNLPMRMPGMKSMPPNMMMGPTAPNAAAYMPNFMGMPVMPGYSGEFDAAQQQRGLAMSGVRDGNTNFQGGMNFMAAQPQAQQLGMYSMYPNMYMAPMMPFPAAMYSGYPPPVPKGSHFGTGAPGFMPSPAAAAAAYGQGYDDVDFKTSLYQPSTQGSKGASTSASYNSSAGGNLGSSYNKSHPYDKSNYQGSSSGLFPAPGNQQSAQAAAAYQQLAAGQAASQHAMMPGLAAAAAVAAATGGTLPGSQSLHSPFHPAVLDASNPAAAAAAAAAAVSVQSQQQQQGGGSGRGAGGAAMPSTSQMPSGGSGGGSSSAGGGMHKHHSHNTSAAQGGGAGNAASMMKSHAYNQGNW